MRVARRELIEWDQRLDDASLDLRLLYKRSQLPEEKKISAVRLFEESVELRFRVQCLLLLDETYAEADEELDRNTLTIDKIKARANFFPASSLETILHDALHTEIVIDLCRSLVRQAEELTKNERTSQ